MVWVYSGMAVNDILMPGTPNEVAIISVTMEAMPRRFVFESYKWRILSVRHIGMLLGHNDECQSVYRLAEAALQRVKHASRQTHCSGPLEAAVTRHDLSARRRGWPTQRGR